MQSGRLQWFLWQVELALRSSKTEDLQKPANLHIEHILPATWQPTWKLKSGALAPSDYASLEAFMSKEPAYIEARERDRVVDTLGNLTLITAPLNQSYGNNPFDAKKAELLKHSLLRLNSSVLEQAAWDVEQISARSAALADKALKRWPRA
jgi:hypothetical protein